MKTFLLLLLITITGFTASATDYYFSNTGSDANSGTSAATPWQTLAKFNAVFASKNAGDNFLFNRGEVYYGNLVVSRSGTSASPITIGAYGSGANPVITGFTTVNAWTNLGNNIWESTSAVTTLTTLNMVVINGVNTGMGRFPNTGYLAYQSHSGNNTITSNALTGSTNWAGAEIVIRSTRWMLQRQPIIMQSGGTITYTGSEPPTDTYGFFIQNDVRTLDVQNEWYFNPSTKKLRIFSAGSPVNVQVATVDELVLNNAANYITYDHIDIVGANSHLFENRHSQNVIIQNCSFKNAGKIAIYINSAVSANESMVINGNVFQDNTISAMTFLTFTSNVWIKNNTINNTGMIPGSGSASGQNDNDAIDVYGDNSLVEYNTINNTGHIAIGLRNRNGMIARYNYITNFGMTKYDVGAIYSWNADSVTVKSRIIDHNIIIGSRQSAEGVGTSDPTLTGIYLDGNSKNTTITNNTISECISEGIHILNSGSTIITDNTCYNNGSQLGFWHAFGGGMPITNMIVKHNNFFAKTKTQLAFYYREDTYPFNTFGKADSNYYARPIDNNQTFQTAIMYTSTNRTLAGWQSLSVEDSHSPKLARSITDTNDLRFEFNATSSNKTISLPYNYVDVKDVSYNGTITLAPYASAVLIKNGAVTGNKLPTTNAGADQIMTLPTNNASLTGNATDSDGTIASYAWTKISGPAAGTITNATSATTTLTALAKGVYQFQLTATDNSAAKTSDTIQVTVNAANIAPTANAGADQSMTLPANNASLSGNATDSDGTISSYAWTKISGPAAGNITNATSANTTLTALTQGVYQFQLTATDNNAAKTSDTLQVTVLAANLAPTTNAGADQTITLPTNNASLTGSATDSDGTIASYAWTIISGPAGTITNPTSASTSATGLTQGVYQFQLKATDNSAATTTDTIQVTVNTAGNLLPAVNPANTVKGLNYKYYEATSYSTVPAFYALTPVKSGTTTNIDITLAKRTTAYAFNFTGFISVPTDGQYTFYTTSDDGSSLYIDNVLVVNNDGVHSSTEQSGTIGLKAGKHAIAVGYFQQGGGNVLAVSYASAGIAKQAIPNSAMYRVSTARRLSVDATGSDLISTPEVVVKAYPNPFIDHIEININGGVAGDYKLMLVDAAGKIVWIAGGVKNAGSFQQSVNTSNLARGIYFLRVVQNNTTSVIKLVK